MQNDEFASNKKRLLAFVIDDIIISLFFLIIFYDQIATLLSSVGVNGEISEASIGMMNGLLAENIIIVFAIKVIYHTILVWQSGMTVGKYVAKIRVISINTHEYPTLPQSFLRASIRLISDTFFYLGYIMAFFTPMRQTLHDKLSNCVVVYA